MPASFPDSLIISQKMVFILKIKSINSTKKMKILPFFLFILLCKCHYIPTWIDKHSNGRESFVTQISIGTPSLYYKLFVSFSHSKISLWTDLEKKSVSYSNELGGSDFVYIGNQYYRLPIYLNSSVYAEFSESGCQDCVGVLGLALGSPIVSLFSDISVSRSTLTLGNIGDEIGWNRRETLSAISCGNEPGLCVTPGEISISSGTFKNQMIIFDPVIQDISLSPSIYDSYTKNKNLYSDPITSWDHINFRIEYTNDYENLETMKYGLKKIQTLYSIGEDSYTQHLSFSIQPEHLIQNIDNGGKRMLIKRGVKNETRLGTEILKHMIFHKVYEGNMILVQLFETNDHVSNANLALFLVLLFLLARWMITHISLFYNDKVQDKRDFMELFYEFLGMAISITSYVLPSTLSLLETHLNLYIGTGFLVGFAFIWNSIEIVIELSQRSNLEKKLSPIFGTKFESNLARVFSHEVLLLTGLWILLLERRLEGVADILVLFVNVILVFVMSFHILIMFHHINYSVFVEPKRRFQNKNFGRFFSFFVIGLLAFGYQSIVSVNFFIRPLFVKSYETYLQILIPGLVFLYIFLVASANYLATLFISHAREKIKKS